MSHPAPHNVWVQASGKPLHCGSQPLDGCRRVLSPICQCDSPKPVVQRGEVRTPWWPWWLGEAADDAPFEIFDQPLAHSCRSVHCFTILLEPKAVPSNFVPDLRREALLEQLEISHFVQSWSIGSSRGEPMDEDSSVDHGGPTNSAVWRYGHTLLLCEGKLTLCIFIFARQNPIQFPTIRI